MSTKFNSNADKWLSRYEIAVNNQQSMFKKFSKWYDLMYASLNTKDYAPWRSKVYLPILANKAWAMMAKLQSLNPGFEVGLYGEHDNDPKAQEKAEKTQWKLEYDWNNPDFDEPMSDKLFAPLVDALVTGTGMAKVPWCTEEKTSYKRPILDKGYVDLSKQVATKTNSGYNDLIPVNIYNVFIQPGAINLYSAEWVIIKEFKTLDSLKSEGKYDPKALSNLEGTRADSDQFAAQKKSRNRLTNDQDPITSDDTLDMIEVFECYEKDSNEINVYASGGSKGGKTAWVSLKSGKNIYWHGKYPLVAFYVRKRPYDFWGEGIFESTERMQMAVIDVFNHFVDSYNLSVNGMIMKQQGEEFKYTVRPGGELEYRQNPPQQFKFADPNPATFQTVAQMIESTIEESTISQYATGTPNSQTDKTSGTATGIMRLQQAAGDKMAYMKTNFATSLRMIGQMWMVNNQQFLATPVSVQGQVDSQPAQVKVTPEDMQVDTVLRINDASMEPVSSQDRVAQFDAYIQQLIQLQQASIQQAQMTKWAVPPVYIDFASVVQDRAQKAGEANFDKIVINGKEVEKLMQSSMSPMIAPNERVNIQPADLLPSEMAQLLQRNGIQPDPGRQQGTKTPNEQVAAGDAAASMAKISQQPTSAPQGKQVSESLSYKDASPYIKSQIEQQAGLQPDPMHAVEAHTALSQHVSDQASNVAGATNQLNGAITDQQPAGVGGPTNG